MGRTSSFSKQVISYLLVLSLSFAPALTNASSAMGGWSLSNPVAKGASTLYNGAKNVLINGKNVAKTSTALITPVAKDVAKVLARGGAAYALSVAVEQLIGAGVDWVLDPANNQIKYKLPAEDNGQYIWRVSGVASTDSNSLSEACQKYASVIAGNGVTWVGKYKSASNSKCHFENFSFDASKTLNPSYDPAKDEEKSIPLETVAQQVISNAESGDTSAQVATTAAAADIVNDAQNDSTKARPIVNQLEANAETKTQQEATGQSKPNTETGATDLSLTFPVFCGWAPLVCEAAQTVISFPQTLTNWWDRSVNALTQAYEYAKTQVQALRDYFKDEPPQNDDTVLDIPDPPLPDINTDINFGGACPVSKTVPISFAGISTQIEFSFQPLCDIASFIKPVVITISAFSSALIIAGIRENE